MIEFWDILDKDGNKTGRLHKRGQPMKKGEYHLVVHSWIMNSKSEFLVSKRAPNKVMPNKWEITGGSAVAGEDSLFAAVREVKEELGIALDPCGAHFMFRRFRRDFEKFIDLWGDFVDVWLFRADVNITDIVFQEDETSDAMWASKDKIKQMIADGLFVDTKFSLPYLDELFDFCESCLKYID